MHAKTCRQCGELKPLTQFRTYYGGRKGTYTTCRSCEKINSRLKYLESKESLTPVEQVERDKIHKLYKVQLAAGLRPPNRGGRRTKIEANLDDMISKYQGISENNQWPDDTPYELKKWLLDEPLTEEPEVYIDEVYEQLCETYMPVISIDRETMIPVRDNTYKMVLDKILQRFYSYEDTYYERDDDND
jgi:hypothetical protein